MIRVRGYLAASLVVAVLGGLDRPARGSGIASPWSGASASTYYNSRADTQQGATASASSGYQGVDTVVSVYPGSSPFTVSTSGTVGATATNDPAHLLSVSASVNTGDPGAISSGSSDSAGATASWSNDSVLVKAPAGSSLPDMIRLNFALTFGFNTSSSSVYNGLTATFNGQTDQVGSEYGLSFVHVLSGSNTASLPTSVDSSNAPAANLPGGLKDTFHVDLPVSSAGLSGPINLSLALSPQVGAAYNNLTMYDLTGNLALTSVTLPDGTTTLASLGDSISFASGLTPPGPNPVPEPASLLAWALVFATAGAAAARARRAA